MRKSRFGPQPKRLFGLELFEKGTLGSIAITPERTEKCLDQMDFMLRERKVTARSLTTLVGRIVSTSAVLGNLARILPHHCQMSVATDQNWDSSLSWIIIACTNFNFGTKI